jgi:hypothetical protein
MTLLRLTTFVSFWLGNKQKKPLKNSQSSMSDLEFLGRVNAQKLKSFAQEEKEYREQMAKDRQRWEDRNKPKAKPPETREPIPEIDQLIASGQVIPASQLAAKKAQAEQLAKDLEESVRSEVSHRRTKIQTEPDKSVSHYTRVPFID